MTFLFKIRDKNDVVKFLAEKGIELFSEGMAEYEVRDKLSEISRNQNPYRTEQSTKRYVNGAIKYIKSGMKTKYDPISFSKEELDYIQSIGDFVLEKEMFILFCLYKCKGEHFSYKNTPFIKECKIKKSEFDVSKLITDNEDSNAFYCALNRYTGCVSPSEYIKSLYNEDNIVFTINNYEDVIYYYERYLNPSKFVVCKKCGRIIKKKNNNQKYCRDCAKEINIQKTIDNRKKQLNV